MSGVFLFLMFPYSAHDFTKVQKALKTKKGDSREKVSSLVPLTIPLSNTFYENLRDIYSLRNVLINQHIIDVSGQMLTDSTNQPNSTIPYRN